MATAAATNLSPGSSGGAAPLEVPWPWVDPARRQVMPKALYQQRREALSLAQALDELQVRRGEGRTQCEVEWKRSELSSEVPSHCAPCAVRNWLPTILVSQA